MIKLRLLFCALAACLPFSAFPDIRYRVVDIGDLPGGYNESAPYGMSSDGRVVGNSITWTNRAHQFYWDMTTGIQDLGTLGAIPGFSYAWGVNSSGSVVGYNLSNGALRATVWDSVNGMRALPALPSGFGIAAAYAINDAGQIAGASQTDVDFHAVIWNSENLAEDLGVVNGDTRSMAYGIGPDGTVVGYSKGTTEQAFVWTPGTGIVGIGQLQPGFDSEAWSVNASGQVVGCSFGSPNRAFLWTQAGGMTDLGDGPAGATSLAAYSINGAGSVVGSFVGVNGQHAYVWKASSGAVDLNSVLYTGSGSWTIVDAAAINDKGWISATGKTSVITLGHAVLLKPVHLVAPSAMSVKLGRLASGGVGDLAVDDGVAARVCKFVVPNLFSPFLRIELSGTVPVLVPTAFKLQVKSKMSNGGAFRQDLALYDTVAGAYTDLRQDVLGTTYQTVELVASSPAKMVDAGSHVLARLEIKQTGPAAVILPCTDIDLVNWHVED